MGDIIKWDDVKDTSPQSLNKLNTFLRTLVSKVTGGLDFLDMNNSVNEQLFTYPIQINGEGNLDNKNGGHPLYIRFFVPEDVKKIKDASINAIVTNYRMDSGIAKAPSQEVIVSGDAGMSTDIAGEDLRQTLSTFEWYAQFGNYFYSFLQNAYNVNNYVEVDGLQTVKDGAGRNTMFFGNQQIDGDSVWYDPLVTAIPVGELPDGRDSGKLYAFLDYARLQHNHAERVNWIHTHPVTLSGTLGPHIHDLDEGIKESSDSPNGIRIYVNDNEVGDVLNGASSTQNNIDISSHVLTGEWNTVKITSESVARITIYGIINVSTKTYK